MGLLDDAEDAARKALANAKGGIRKEAASGARDAVMPWVLLAIGLSLYAISRKR